jgi:HK97 family phage prohead protease
MGKKTHEYKMVPQFVKMVEGRTVDGIFSVAGIIDSYGDIVHAGSFAKTIAERSGDILHLWQHDFWSPPTAVISELREIGRDELPEEVRSKYPDATGGAMVRRKYIESARADEVLAAIAAGSPLQMSYGYDAIRYEFEELDDGQVVRHLNEQRLWETSDVLWGANQATQASKEAPSIPIETLMGQLDRWLSSIKAGRRNAEKDLERINKIGILAIELGADSVILASAADDDEEKSAVGMLIDAAKESETGTAETTDDEETQETITVIVTDDDEETNEDVIDETADEETDEETNADSIEETDDEKQRRDADIMSPLTLDFARLDLLALETEI